MIVGVQTELETLGLQEGEDLMTLSQSIQNQASAWKANGLDCICLCDLLGASPFNAAAIALAEASAILVPGLHLPFLLELLNLRSQGLSAAEAAKQAQEAGNIYPQVLLTDDLFSELKKEETQ